ncbi:3-hydroxyacyl-CoA dehydrogenase NAD-binding domain-containing protein [Streptomyces canus]|uniref:3-hydroxyacyl-CoA dehydrogenase NAD-binding domain-containing protein n=1 Tax=Streptomyces canus TaxID=58343 RepID=UPI0036E940B7
MNEHDVIRWTRDEDGVVVLTLDDPAQSANTMNASYIACMERAVDRLEAERDRITGVVITSAKKTFLAGGDLHDIRAADSKDSSALLRSTSAVKDQLRRLEQLGRPVVAAVNGSALGGGLELALACHHRIAADTPGCRIGLPEVTLGLLPGGGGIARTVRMLGVDKALTGVLLQGPRLRPSAARNLGLVNEVVDTVEELLPRARAWIRENPSPVQPWDTEGHRVPGDVPAASWSPEELTFLPASLREQVAHGPVPALRAITTAAVEGARTGFDDALDVETRCFLEVATGQVAKNMIQTFFDLQHIASGGSRPAGHPVRQAHRVGVLGAGMMGAGIASVCAKAGLDVVLKDVSQEAATRGKDHSARLLAAAVRRGRTTRTAADEVLARIAPTTLAGDLTGCDVVIEAVFESQELKHKVFAEVEDVVDSDALLGSNTSSLPITGLAHGVRHQENFIGLHFFSPVDRMPLLEVIRGERTSDATLARAFDLAGRIGKTPIVVNDSRGFFTSRVIGARLNEALTMVGEGLDPAVIEEAGRRAGYPAPPLQLIDELSLTLWRKVREETREALRTEGTAAPETAADGVARLLVEDFGRGGRAVGAGLYDYAEGRRTGLWPGLREHFAADGKPTTPFEDIAERLLFAEALEAVHCFDEGVITSDADANVGSLLGIGFPAWTGGVVQYVKGYAGGAAGFSARAEQLATRYGDRFSPPASLPAATERKGSAV